MTEAKTVERGRRKERRGKVVSRSGDKSVVVSVERLVKHSLYGKYVRKSRKLHAHDEKNEAKVGDTVRVVECRPYSRMKRWRMVEVQTSGTPAEAKID